ncbi:hypothetical protein Ahia01_001372100 [Argonauta hians]
MTTTNPDFSTVCGDITPFFTKPQLDAMSEYEKLHLENLRRNYEAMIILVFRIPVACSVPNRPKQKVKTVTKGRSNRARRTAPQCVAIAESNIPGAGLGVFALLPIKTRSKFGPYEGKLIENLDEAHYSGYSWQVWYHCLE